MAGEFTLSAGTLPSNACYPSTPQELIDLLPSFLTVNFAESLSFFNFGNSTPSPDYQGRPWIKTDANGFIDGTYVYANGAWSKRHPLSPACMIMFHDSASNILTLDGGSSDNPFWVPCDGGTYTGNGSATGGSWTYTSTDMRGLVAVCAGTGIDPLDATKSLTPRIFDQTLGEEGHVQKSSEVGSHTHPTPLDGYAPLSNKYPLAYLTNSASAISYDLGDTFKVNANQSQSSVTAANVMQPSRVTNFIIRTPRIF